MEEWEYAARGGKSGWLYPWGNVISHSNVNCKVNGQYNPIYKTGNTPYISPAVSFAPNAYGLYNMGGNLWEWCWDYQVGNRLTKGGAWNSPEYEVRCGHSGVASPGNQGNFLGFRTVRNAASASEILSVTLDSRDYMLAVSSDHGQPDPMVGANAFAWGATIDCYVESVVNEGGTNFSCTGWTGSGDVPMLGTSNHVVVELSNLVSSITWSWVLDDSDSDGMKDEWEKTFFGNLDQAGTNDFDLDGHDNFSEYIAGTNPTNAASLFALMPELGADEIILRWPSVSNRIYNLYWTPNLMHISFQPLETNMAFPRNSATSSIPAGASPGFYLMDVTQ